MQPLFASVAMSKVKDGSVHVRNSGFKELNLLLCLHYRAGGMLADVIDNMMSVIVAIHKHENARKEAHFILRKFVVYLFKAIDEQDIVSRFFISLKCSNPFMPSGLP